MAMTLYHGSDTDTLVPSLAIRSLCLADEHIAETYATAGSSGSYAGTAWVHEIELDDTGLVWVEVEDYDADECCDPEVPEGADVIEYDDVDVYGYRHRTVALVSERALAAARVVASRPVE